MTATALKQPTIQPPIYDEHDQDVRREMLRRAQHENHLEGQELNPKHDHLREAYIRGELNADQLVAAIRKAEGIPEWEDTKRRLAAGEKVKGY